MLCLISKKKKKKKNIKKNDFIMFNCLIKNIKKINYIILKNLYIFKLFNLYINKLISEMSLK